MTMTWTTDIPKVSGVYWMKADPHWWGEENPIPVEVAVDTRVIVYIPGTDDNLVIPLDRQIEPGVKWYGPLEAPEDTP